MDLTTIAQSVVHTLQYRALWFSIPLIPYAARTIHGRLTGEPQEKTAQRSLEFALLAPATLAVYWETPVIRSVLQNLYTLVDPATWEYQLHNLAYLAEQAAWPAALTLLPPAFKMKFSRASHDASRDEQFFPPSNRTHPLTEKLRETYAHVSSTLHGLYEQRTQTLSAALTNLNPQLKTYFLCA
ncbi:hypothetical protein COY95_02990, partial [Candidatus Woesearchaeota archaeon CG_4_10_14_0_8_um_filter_47_5]